MKKRATQWTCGSVVRLLVLAVGLSSGMSSQAEARSYVLRTCDQHSPATLRAKAREYQNLIDSVSVQYGVNPNLIKAVITAETCFRPRAVSHKGAFGLMQLMPATAVRFGATDTSITHNVHAGTRYLRWLLERYQGSVHHAVAAYNSGEGTVDRHGLDVPYQETKRYVAQVMNAYQKLNGQGASGLTTTARHVSPRRAAARAGQTQTYANIYVGESNGERVGLYEGAAGKEGKAEAASVQLTRAGRRLVSSVVERRLTPKAEERRLLPSCMTLSRQLHRATYHRDKKGERTFFYTVKDGDSLDKIMRATGSSAIMIKRYNDLERSLIKPGQKLKVSECRL